MITELLIELLTDTISTMIEDGSMYHQERIGEGVYSRVYRYDHLAVKITHEEHECTKAFGNDVQKEAKILQSLQKSPFFPNYHGHGKNYVVMQEVKGHTFKEHLEKGLFLSPNWKELLHKAFKQSMDIGYVPWDIHSGNVMVNQDGIPVLIDVGSYLCKYTYSKVTHKVAKKNLDYFIQDMEKLMMAEKEGIA